MSALRGAAVVVLVLGAVSLQVGFFPSLAVMGVVPDLALLVVVGAALVRGPEYGAVVGFVAGLALDVAPPADHTAGRWALALVVVGYLAGLVRRDARASALASLVVVAAGAFIGTSLFAISGLVLADPGVTFERALDTVPVAVAYDLVLTPFVVPLVILVFNRLEPPSERAQPYRQRIAIR